MKKYLLILAAGAVMLGSACDSMNEETVTPPLEESLVEPGAGSQENLRKGTELEHVLLAKVNRNYRLMENAYPLLLVHLPKEEAERQREDSRGKAQFVMKMINRSLKVFDSNIQGNGRFLSPESRRNHSTLSGDEHEFEYDILAFGDDEEAAFDAYIKIPDIDGESGEEVSFNFAKIEFENSAAGKCQSIWCDSFPDVIAPQIEETLEFLKRVDRFNAEPAQTQAGLLELELNAGLDPVAIGLLVPAIQKVREAARINARGKADILIESLSNSYELDLSEQKGKFLRYGGAGSIAELISEDYDDTGDLDWATIQLNRSKFELEMLMLWSRYWDSKTGTDPTGR